MTYLTENLPLTAAKAKEFILNNKDTWAADYQWWARSSQSFSNMDLARASILALFKEADKKS